MDALYLLVIIFFHSGDSELALTTLQTYVLHIEGYSGPEMSKAFLLQICVNRQPFYICAFWQSSNTSATTMQVIEISFSFEGEV